MASSAVAKSSKYTYRSTGGAGTADVSIEYSADLSALSRLEDKIRLLQDDLESERELRQRIERERADLSVQVIQLSERLEEAEGGAESQFEINKKRDTELAKLRKLLEDVHLESEETAHLLRKKHQEVVVDFQDQIDQLSKARARADKEKSKFQQEVYELLAQLDNVTKEKLMSIKTVEKLEIHISELNVKIEELNRTIVDITSHKTRLSQENIELVKEVQDLKVNIENVTYLKTQIAGQLDDARRRLEDEERRRALIEASLHQVEVELESVRVQLEEESEARLDIERQLVKANGEVSVWRSKYETEANARIEEVEELRRKYTARIQEQEEQIETLLVKINNLEKQKSRLQSEVEVLIIDLEKANGTARELQKRVEHLEKINIELKTRLDESLAMYEQSQRDLRNKQQELQRVNAELDKTRELKDQLARENKKLGDDLSDAKNQLADMNRRLHELELELRRLENEREELAAAYKEAEAVNSKRIASKSSLPELEKRIELPELPWSDSKVLWEDKKVQPYTRDDLIKYAIDAEDKARDHLSHFKIANRSDFSLAKTVQASRVTKEIFPRTGKDLKRLPMPLMFASTRARSEVKEIQQEAMSNIKLQALKDVRMMTEVNDALKHAKSLRGKSAKAIEFHLRTEALKNLSKSQELADIRKFQKETMHSLWDDTVHSRLMNERAKALIDEDKLIQPLDTLSKELRGFEQKSSNYFLDKSKQTSIEIEQLNARVVEAETKLKTEVQRIKKKLQIQITELELSLDVANKNNIDLQKTIKKQSLTLTELQAHYDEIQRQLQVTLDQLGISQRRLQSLTAELEEVRGNYESALRAKRTVEQQYEESVSRINELTTINVNLASSRAKLEQELATLAGDYEEVTKELRVSDERYQRVQNELKHTVEILHEEQERIVKIEAIKKSLEIEVKNLSVRLEEVEANAIVGGKRIISKLEARFRVQFWSILFLIHYFNIVSMIIGIFFLFVDIMLTILNNDIIINEYKINICIRCFICEILARSFIKDTVNFNDYSFIYGCSFPRIEMPNRTDATFRSGYVYGTLGLRKQCCLHIIKLISDFLLRCRIPSNILCYFFCNIVICYSNSYSNYLHVADKLFKTFIECYIKIYGIYSVSSNIHHLCHSVDNLSTFNAYPLENSLQKIKKLLRMGNKSLLQI
ncbi:Paramyosin [Atta colombica]|uniref:Paramyosin n=1 Tax=Atta colombica TaxID=520822 RepID=A0A195BV74_9HYME|nr:Paramyosin [Atta colombica]